MLRAAIVGIGTWGRNLVTSVQGKSDAIRFVAGATRTPEKAAEFCAQHGIRLVASYDELLKDKEVDAVVLATPHSQHCAQIVAAIRAGKHVFTEKLLAPTVEECETLLDAAREADVALVVSLPRLDEPVTRAITALIDSGALGTITSARVRMAHDGWLDGWLPERFGDPVAAIGGALTDLGCHPVYLVQRILGPLPQSVDATYGRVTGHPVEDNAVVTVGYPNGAIGVIEAGFVSPNPFEIEIGGTEGIITFNDKDGVVVARGKGFGDGPEQIAIADKAPSAYHQWVDHIQQGTRADANIAAAVELTRLVVAANESARTGKTFSYSQN